MALSNAEVLLKDAYDDVFGPMDLINIGASGSPLYIPAHLVMDQYGNPLFNTTNPGVMASIVEVVAVGFTRPSNSTPYTSGDLVANSVTAASVVPMTLPVARVAGGTCSINRARLLKSTTSLTTAIFRAHLYKTLPATITNGDNSAWLTNQSSYVGSFTFDFTGSNARVFSDGAKVIAVPDVGTSQTIETGVGSQSIFALLEVLSAYTPGSAEVFTLTLEVTEN